MVRGAYMDEERALAKKKNEESPICDSFELTTQSFHGNIKHVLENLTPNSEVSYFFKKYYIYIYIYIDFSWFS